MSSKYHSPLPLTYINIRKVVGIFAMSLPLAIFLAEKVFFQGGLLTSISAYYYTEMGWFFIAVLCMIGFFLLFYQGYEPQETDRWFTKTFTDRRLAFLAGIAAFLTAFLPTMPGDFPFNNVDPADLEKCVRPLTGLLPNLSPAEVCNVTGYVHLASAATMFLTVAYFSWFRFTKSEKGEALTKEKIKRNIVYRICGAVIFAAILVMAFADLWKNQFAHTVYWGEFVSLVAFGITWSVKGEALWKDTVSPGNSESFNVLQSRQYKGYKSGLPFFVFLVALWFTVLLYAAEAPPFNLFAEDEAAPAAGQADQSAPVEPDTAPEVDQPEVETRSLGYYKTDARDILMGILFLLVVIVVYFILNNQALSLFWPLVRRNFRADLADDTEGKKEALWTLFMNQINELGDQPRFSINPRAESAVVAPTTLTPDNSYLKTFFDLIAWIFPRFGYSLRLTKLSSKDSGLGLSFAVVRNDGKESIAEKIFWADAFGIEKGKDDDQGDDLKAQRLMMIPAYYWFKDVVDRMDGFEPEPHDWESAAYYRLGDQLWHSDLDKGITCYSNSINFNQKNLPAYAALARVWIEKSQDYFKKKPKIAIEYLLLANSYLTIVMNGSNNEQKRDQVYFGALYNRVVALKYLHKLGWNRKDCTLEEILKQGNKTKEEAVSVLGRIRTEQRAASFQELKSHRLADWLVQMLPALEFVLQSLEAQFGAGKWKSRKNGIDIWLSAAIDEFAKLPGFEPPINMDRPLHHADKSGLHFTNTHYRIQYNAACFYSQLAELAPEDKKDKFKDLALDHLVMALSAGGGLEKFAKIDSSLGLIRSHPRYTEFMKGKMEEKPKKKTAKKQG